VALIVAAGLTLLAGASFVRRVGSTRPFVGVDWTQSSIGPVAVHVEPDSPAGRSGLTVGDVLVEIGDKPVASALEAAELAWSGDPTETVESFRQVRFVMKEGVIHRAP